MAISRRTFIRDGVAGLTVALSARGFLDCTARAYSARPRALVMLHLRGGNDALSMLVPYTDPFYYRRRPSIAVPAADVLRIGTDAAGHALGLHPRLTVLHRMFNDGHVAIVPRAGCENSSRSHFEATDAWNMILRVADHGCDGERVALPGDRLPEALRAVRQSITENERARVFCVEAGGYDTHSGQGTVDGDYARRMATLNQGLSGFYAGATTQRMLDDTLVVLFSEFGRGVSENGSEGTEHGAAGVMMAIGGSVRGGLHGTAADLNPDPANVTLENDGADVRYETDFRAVYARVLDRWLGASSVEVLGGDYRTGAIAIV